MLTSLGLCAASVAALVAQSFTPTPWRILGKTVVTVPGCPVDRAEAIALHAAARGSGRVGRSAAGRALEPDAVHLAVVASVRHVDTDYDDLLMSGVDRESARAHVHQRVEDVVSAWRDGPSTSARR